MRDETYLSRVNCEYRDYLIELCAEFGVGFQRGFRSEREDWIMTMVAAGMGICFLPEYSAIHPGIRHRLRVRNGCGVRLRHGWATGGLGRSFGIYMIEVMLVRERSAMQARSVTGHKHGSPRGHVSFDPSTGRH